MATAKRITSPPVEPEVISLNLTQTEAEIIKAFTQMVAGLPEKTYRSVTDDIGEALRKAGVDFYGPATRYFESPGRVAAQPRNRNL